MFRDYMCFKWKTNDKIALCCTKEELNQHIDFVIKNFKSLSWKNYWGYELKELGYFK